ncbi:MAG: prohibitin family protein [Eubacteriales bacterium]
MVAIIFAAIIIFVGVMLCITLFNKSKLDRAQVVFPGRKFVPVVAIAAVLLAGVILFLGSSVSIPTGHTGVVTTFGRVENFTLDAGFHLKSPIQEVVCMDNRVQKATKMLPCFSSDIQEVQLLYTLNYQINKNNAQEIYKTVGKDYYDTVITPNVAEAVKVVTARYSAEELVGSRDELAKAIEELLATQLSSYNIEVVSTAIEDMDFTDAFTNAVEAKQVAAQNKLQAQIEQEQKTMEQQAKAERDVIEAEAAAEVARIQAQADLEVTKIQADAAEYAGQKESAKNKAIAETLTPELIQYYQIQQWDGKYPETYVGSDNVNAILNTKKD